MSIYAELDISWSMIMEKFIYTRKESRLILKCIWAKVRSDNIYHIIPPPNPLYVRLIFVQSHLTDMKSKYVYTYTKYEFHRITFSGICYTNKSFLCHLLYE